MAEFGRKGAPNEFTPANAGDICVDTETGGKYQCLGVIGVSGEKKTKYYMWVGINKGTSGGNDCECVFGFAFGGNNIISDEAVCGQMELVTSDDSETQTPIEKPLD